MATENDSKLSITIVKWKEGCFDEILSEVNRAIAVFKAKYGNIPITEKEVNITQSSDMVQKEIRALFPPVGSTEMVQSPSVTRVFLVLGDVLINALNILLEDENFSKVLTDNAILIVTSIGSCSESVNPNVVHCWSPSSNTIARYAAKKIHDDGKKTVLVKEFLPEEMTRSQGMLRKAFGTFFKALGGELLEDTNQQEKPDAIYLTGFGAEYDKYLRGLDGVYNAGNNCINPVKVYADAGVSSTLIQDKKRGISTDYCRDVCYFDYCPNRKKSAEEAVENNYVIFVREMLNFISRLKKRQGQPLSKSLSAIKYHATESGDIFLLSDAGRFVVPLSSLSGGVPKLVFDTENIDQKKVASALDVVDEAMSDFVPEVYVDYSLANSELRQKILFLCEQALSAIFDVVSAIFLARHPNIVANDELFMSWSKSDEKNGEDCFSTGVIDVFLEGNDVTQINYNNYDDYEDNGTFRFFAVRVDVNDGQATLLPIHYLSYEELSTVETFVLAKTEHMARYAWLNINANVKGAKVFVEDDVVKALRDFLLSLYGKWKSGKYVYVFTYKPDQEGNTRLGAVVMWADRKLDYLSLQALRTITSKVLVSVFYGLSLHDARVAQTKSAIGSIMSRNGSHNIGSHVLAALSHNVGTMPDDRVLYQYIQHRMDYIATATTDFPTWSGETKFVNGLIRRFLSQRHLLDYIAGSEGLHAFKFQDPNVSGTARREQTNTIKLHVRRKDYNGNIIADFITEDNEVNGGSVIDKLKNDVSVAMPGGVIGAHAFFTILENVIRNAAKHGWAKQKNNDMSQDLRAENLDVYVDFQLDKDGISVTIFDNMSDVFSVFDKMTDDEKDWLGDYQSQLKTDKGDDSLVEMDAITTFIMGSKGVDALPLVYRSQYDILKKRTPESLKVIADRLMGEEPEDGSLGNRLWLPLHHGQQVKLKRPFINELGSLRRENWGLAEMKISAGYLNKRSISDIGGITEGKPIITTVCVEQEEKFKHEEGDDVLVKRCHLGYRFKIPRPREVAFVCDLDNINPRKIEQLQELGVFIVTPPEGMNFVKPKNDGENDWNFAYVVLPVLPDQEDPHLPFRVLAKENTRCPDMVPLATFYDDIDLRLHGEEPAETIASDLKNMVYQTWINYWCRKRGFEARNALTRPPLRIMPTEIGNSGRSKQGLVSNFEVWDFVFKEMFRSIVGDLLQKADAREFTVTDEVYWYLVILAVMPKALNPDGSIFTFDDKDNIVRNKVNDNNNKDDHYECDLIFKQMTQWFGEFVAKSSAATKDMFVCGLQMFSSNYGIRMRGLKIAELTYSEIEEHIIGKARTFQEIVENCIANRLFVVRPGNLLYVYDGKKANGMVRFVNNMSAAYREADVMLRKYEERIVSLPAFLSDDTKSDKHSELSAADQSIGSEEVDFKHKIEDEVDGLGVKLFYGQCEEPWDGRAIVLERHAKSDDYNNDKMLYLEPLSGTQSYLYELMQLPEDDSAVRMLTKIYETGLSRVLIADERVSKFLRSRPDEIKTLCRMGVWCVDETKFGASTKINEKAPPIEMIDSLIELNKDAFEKLISDVVNNRLPPQMNLISNNVRNREQLKFDILIIHQGLIDKWLPQSGTSSEKVSSFIRALRHYVPYVVITTGRGTPANIPDSARILPFPVLETTLFKKYPEKMVLVDTIMNILPIGAHK